MLSQDRQKQLTLISSLMHGTGLLVLVLGVTVFQAAMLGPLAVGKQGVERRIIELDKELAKSSGVRAEYARLNEILADIEQRTATFRERIPARPLEAEFLHQLTEIANAEGLRMQDYRRSGVNMDGDPATLEVTLVCGGDYGAICGFLDGLDNLERVTAVKRMKIASTKTDNTYLLELNLTLYFGVSDKAEKQEEQRDESS